MCAHTSIFLLHSYALLSLYKAACVSVDLGRTAWNLGRTAFPALHILYTPVVLCGGLRSAGLFHFGMQIVVVLAQLLLRQPRL